MSYNAVSFRFSAEKVLLETNNYKHELATKQREIAELVDARKTYNLNEGLILTYDEMDEFEIDVSGISYKMTVQPLWKWLL